MPSATARTSRTHAARATRAGRLRRELSAALRSGRLPALCFALAAAILLYGFLWSGDFLVRSVVVEGAHLGNPAEIVTTGDAIGEPIFRIDAADAAERVARLPYLERATVRTRFPDEVVIRVVERVPVVSWQVGDRSFLVDAEGHILAEAVDASLPLVVAETDVPRVGGTVRAEEVAAVIAASAAFGEHIEELRWTRAEGLVARLIDTRLVILGDVERLPLKLAVYAEVAKLDADWTTLDLREPDRPYYK
jgi:cell division protein FtsQ